MVIDLLTLLLTAFFFQFWLLKTYHCYLAIQNDTSGTSYFLLSVLSLFLFTLLTYIQIS